MEENIDDNSKEIKEETKKSSERIVDRKVEEEMKQSYLDYAMSVIVGRALPDVRDGLKPVHRRILYTMWQSGLLHNKPFRKSANVVGNCMAKFHPHGDAAIYDTLVRMAQEFSLRYPLVWGQGNFGCFTGDTKVKLTDSRELSFKELIKEDTQGKKNFTYAVNSEGLIEIAEIKNPRLTKKKEKIMKVVLDNGEEIKCTLDHRFMLKDGSYKEAQKLKPGDSLMPFYIRDSVKEDNLKPALLGYEMIYQPKSEDWVGCHVLADNWNLKEGVYEKKEGKIRHHIDFNKSNNDPNNIIRIQWKDHWRLHAEHASELHKNPEYRMKISEGRKRFWSKKENRERAAELISKRNLRNWQDQKYRERMKKIFSEGNIEYSKSHPELREEKSKRLKELWNKSEYREMMSSLKSREMIERWENNDPSLNKFSSEESKNIWSRPGHKELISKISKELWQDKEYKKRMSAESKKRWKDPSYLSKFSESHFSDMAKKLWTNPLIRKLHQEKARLQWQDSEFRKKFIEGVKARNQQRMKQDPYYMKELTKKSKAALRKKWQDPSYKEKVMRAKILNYVNIIIKNYPKITPEKYEEKRKNNCIPKIKTALNYFNDFSDMVEQAKVYNHKVVGIEFLKQRQDVYDLTIKGNHNFALAAGVFVHNSIDGDSAAAMRYSEARLSKISEPMLHDIDKETVKFVPNFDNSTKEPSVLPSKIPNLLVNGSSGIAVGMATNIPPHNIVEICNGIAAQIKNPDISISELMQYIKGPDFPTGAIICGNIGIKHAYETGRSKIIIRAKVCIEDTKGRKSIIINEIPYMVNKREMIEEIADFVNSRKIDGISDIRDESDREGIRVIIELKKEANENVVLNQLYKHTRIQTTFGIIMLALVNNEPKVLNLKQLIKCFIDHRKEVVKKRTEFDLKKAQEREHILGGLLIALNNIDDVIKLIKESESVENAKNKLISIFKLSEKQSLAVLDMKLQKLAHLEQDNLKKEMTELKKSIDYFKSILASEQKLMEIIISEINELKEKYGDERRTEISFEEMKSIEIADLVKHQDMVITITHSGYIKTQPLNTYRQQKRGGKGIIGAGTTDEDFVEDIFISDSHSYILFFTNKGKVHWQKVYHIPEASRQARGKAIVNLLGLEKDEKVTAFIPVPKFDDQHYLIMATKKGIVKKTNLNAYSNPRKGGIIAITLAKDDELVGVVLTDGNKEIILATKNGNAVRFNEKRVRAAGRSAQGVRGARLRENDEVISQVIASNELSLLTVTENGYGKRTMVNEYRLTNRGSIGVRNIMCSERNGKVVSVKSVTDNDEVMIISQHGIIIRIPAKGISVIGRSTQGMRLMKLEQNDKVVAAAKIVKD